MKQVKQIEVLEDGYLKLTLMSRKDYDPYMLELINAQAYTIPCIQKKRSATTFLYDPCERISLQRYLALYEFEEKEVIAFLLQLFEQLQMLVKDFPVLIDLRYLYCDLNQKKFYGIVLPIHDRDLLQDWSKFLDELINEIKVIDADALIGRLARLSRNGIWSGQEVVEVLMLWRKQAALPQRLQRWLEHKKNRKQRQIDNETRLHEEYTRMRLLQRSQRGDTTISKVIKEHSSDTVVLFPKAQSNAYLEDENGNKISINDTLLIGRGSDCDVVLSEATISTHHAKIIRQEQGFMICDLSSSNGTRVNQKKCKANQNVLLHHQDQIQLAKTTLQFFMEEEG